MRRTVIPPLALTIAAVLAFAGQAVAQIEGPYHLMAGLAPGIGERAAAMGDAQVAVARDATALYWNPAALALSGRRQWHVGSAHFEGYHLDLDELGDMLSRSWSCTSPQWATI